MSPTVTQEEAAEAREQVGPQVAGDAAPDAPDAVPGDVADAGPGEIVHAAFRGAVAAGAMTGMRAFTVSIGLVEEPPPRAILRQRAHGLMKRVPRRRRRAIQEAAHWGYGAFGGAVFGALPAGLRKRRWAGPAYGLAIWLGFEAGIAPALGLSQAKRPGRWSAPRSPPTTFSTASSSANCVPGRAGSAPKPARAPGDLHQPLGVGRFEAETPVEAVRVGRGEHDLPQPGNVGMGEQRARR